MHILIIEPEAKNDLVQAMAFYDGEREGLRAVFLEEVRAIFERIGEIRGNMRPTGVKPTKR